MSETNEVVLRQANGALRAGDDERFLSLRSAYCAVWRVREGGLAELRAFVVVGSRNSDAGRL